MVARRTGWLLTFGIVTLTATTLLWAAGNKTAELEKKRDALLHERVATAERGVEATSASYDSGWLTLDLVIESHEHLAEAKLAVAKSGKDCEAALTALITSLRSSEEKIAALHHTGSRGGEAHLLAMIQYARQTAEIRLLEEQIKTATAK